MASQYHTVIQMCTIKHSFRQKEASNLEEGETTAYQPHLTPVQVPSEPLPMEEEPQVHDHIPDIHSWKDCGLVAQSIMVGVLSGAIPATTYAFLMGYLNMEGAQILSAQAVLDSVWCLKAVYAMFLACVPIRRYRFKPYMALGWLFTFSMLLPMACWPAGDPFFTNPRVRLIKPENYTTEDLATLNPSAPKQGGRYVMFMMAATCGYLLSDTALDGMLFEVAEREPLDQRGHFQAKLFGVRFIATAFGRLLVGLLLNDESYGGDFGFALGFQHLMILLCVLCFVVLFLSWFCVDEINKRELFLAQAAHQSSSQYPTEDLDNQHPIKRLQGYLLEAWELLQTRAMYQIVGYNFLSGVLGGFAYTAKSPIQFYWSEVTPLNDSLAEVIGMTLFARSVWKMDTSPLFLRFSWRQIRILSIFLAILVDGIRTLLTTWDIVRNKWFWLPLQGFVNFPHGITLIMSTLVTLELVKGQNTRRRALIHGMMTLVINLAGPFGIVLTRNLNSFLDLSNKRILNDTYGIRMDITIAVLLMFGMKFISVMSIVLLPKDKDQVQELKQKVSKKDQHSSFYGLMTLGYLTITFCWASVTNIVCTFFLL